MYLSAMKKASDVTAWSFRHFSDFQIGFDLKTGDRATKSTPGKSRESNV